jgi:hypothetical protein
MAESSKIVWEQTQPSRLADCYKNVMGLVQYLTYHT